MKKAEADFHSIARHFENEPNEVYALSDLEAIWIEHGKEWNFPKKATVDSFVQALLDHGLRELRLQSPHYSSILRYVWGNNAPSISVAISIMRNGAYFSHASAMWIHGLGGDEKNIFVNKEQAEKPRYSNTLSQEAIHRAFRRPQRRSQMFYEYLDTTITLLSGKHTGRLGVEVARAPSGHEVEVTSVERTLIDATVRPEYAGGVDSVLKAYRLAATRASLDKLSALLDQLDYIYPYRQSVGFYLEKAGYPDTDKLLTTADTTRFDFYISHALRDAEFDPKWRIFFPKTLK